MSCKSKKIAVCAQHITKHYEIYDKPSHRLWQMLFHGSHQFYRPFWALNDVSFSVECGECVGIIGRNGAGKSTILQILTGTLSPTAGKVIISGRVAALLELGSGFNPEFTGKENVYLNAAILGLTEQEIQERYQHIIEFADIGEFIDQPVKNYSSGMTVRLAFAVIAHVDADILIIDEALSVGDAYFTQKCMRFLHQFMEKHTVVFVSHDIPAVKSLCNRVILMDHGAIKFNGSPKKATELYLKEMYENLQGSEATHVESTHKIHTPHKYNEADFFDMRSKMINASTLRNDIQIFKFNEKSSEFGKKGILIEDAALVDLEDKPYSWIIGGEQVQLKVHLHAVQDIYSPIIGFQVKNRFGQTVFGDNTFLVYRDKPYFVNANSDICASFSFTMPILEAGDYSIAIAVASGTQSNHVQHDWKNDALMLKSTNTSCATGICGVPMHSIKIQDKI